MRTFSCVVLAAGLVATVPSLWLTGCAGADRAQARPGSELPAEGVAEPVTVPSTVRKRPAIEQGPAATTTRIPPVRPAARAPPAVAAVAASPSPSPLDLQSLETRLKETPAIGVFTKIALKNQVDDLLDRFRAYYRRQAPTTLAELRQPYDMLLLKLLALLQDRDPPLARDVVASREAIWGILADQKKFTASHLMAGVAP